MSFQFKEKDVAGFSPEDAWKAIERGGEVLLNPGRLQAELRINPEFGPEYVEKTNELLKLLIDNFDLGVNNTDEPVLKQISALFKAVTELQLNHLSHEIGTIGIAMQCVPFNELITGVDEDFSSLKGKVDEEQIATLKKEAEEEHTGLAVAKLDPRVMKVLYAGVLAVGGQGEFTKLQAEVNRVLPDNVKANPHQAFATQLTGALSMSLVNRCNTAEWAKAQICATIESVVAAKQAISVNTLCAWGSSPTEILPIFTGSTLNAILRRMNDAEVVLEPTSAAEEPQPEVKPNSTFVAGNGTVN